MQLMQEEQLEEGNVPKIEWKEGEVCPVVADTNEFAKVNKQIVQEVEEQEEAYKNEPTREDSSCRLPGNVIE